MMVSEHGRIDTQTLVGLLNRNGDVNVDSEKSDAPEVVIELGGVFYDTLLKSVQNSINELVLTFKKVDEKISANNFTIKVLDYMILDSLLLNLIPENHEEFLEKFTSNINDPELLSWINQHKVSPVSSIEVTITEVISATLTDIKNQLLATTGQE